MECMSTTMLGEKAYTLKNIEANIGIPVRKLRNSIKCGNLKPSGKSCGAYYVIQSELDRYLKLWKNQLNVEQLRLANHMTGLNRKRTKFPYRNYFYSECGVKEIEDLINKGLAVKRAGGMRENDIYYFLTKECIELLLGKEITKEQFKEI